MLIAMLLASTAIAQKEHVFINCDYAYYGIAVDGVVDAAWCDVDPILMEVDGGDKPYSLYDASFSILWGDTYLFMLCQIDDDDHCDQWCTGLEDWQSDRLEVYLDMNEILDDGLGAQHGPESGHYRFISPWFENVTDTIFDFTDVLNNVTYKCGYILDWDYFDYEFAWKWEDLTDSSGASFMAYGCEYLGLQVTMADVDLATKDTSAYCQWLEGDAWTNMDDMGVIFLYPGIGQCHWEEPGMTINVPIKLSKVYPNPAEDYIVIETEPGLVTEVKIFNVTGQEISYVNNYVNNSRIDLTGYVPGLYYFSVYSENGVLCGMNKFVINR